MEWDSLFYPVLNDFLEFAEMEHCAEKWGFVHRLWEEGFVESAVVKQQHQDFALDSWTPGEIQTDSLGSAGKEYFLEPVNCHG